MRMRKKPNLDSRIERCAHLLISQLETPRGKWLDTYPYEKLHLELGCGKGRFIVQTAQENPDILFIAVEKAANVIVAALELAVSENVQNVRFINAPAEQLSEFFAPAEVSKIYINFCDPWPLGRHIKRRLVCGSFLRQYKDFLTDGGEICFKTDSRPLFDFALREFENNAFILSDTLYDLHKAGPIGVMTEYESKFQEQGMPIYYVKAANKNQHSEF